MPYSDFLSSLLLISACIAIMVSGALAFFNRIQPFANRLLALSLFCVAVFSIVSALLINHFIFQVPHAFRIGAPLQYLIAPCAYLYVRTILQGESRFRKYDWLHFIPFALHTAELMPFFLQTAAYKLKYLQHLLVDLQGVIKLKEGLLPDYFHAIIKFVQGNIYVGLQWYLVWQFRRETIVAQIENNQSMIRWLLVFSLLNTFLYTPTLLAILLPLHPDVTTLFALFSLGGYLLICAVVLFYQPKILYGLAEIPASATALIPPIPVPVAETREEQTKSLSISYEKKNEFKHKIETYMQQQRPYLVKGYSMKDLSCETAIPLHQLSAFINGEYGMNFSDFINGYRVEYAKEKLRDPQWRQLTLEGVAMEAGFNNRITFFRAFTKLTGTTPSEYLNEQITP